MLGVRYAHAVQGRGAGDQEGLRRAVPEFGLSDGWGVPRGCRETLRRFVLARDASVHSLEGGHARRDHLQIQRQPVRFRSGVKRVNGR